jgi:aminoglycoside phosphotransferase (APT) family kinase protein
VEYIGHGSYNCVIGVTIKASEPRRDSGIALGSLMKLFSNSVKLKEYVVRIPINYEKSKEDLADELLRDVAVLQVVAPRLSVPIPIVVEYDMTSNNVLVDPYVIQTRLRGSSLQTFWDDLNCRQRVSAIKQITKITEKIAAVTASTAGFISVDNLKFPSTSHIENAQFPVPLHKLGLDSKFTKPRWGPAAPQTPLEWITEQCERWCEYEEIVSDTDNRERWWQLVCIARSLERKGWLGETFHLVHNDLFARNLMAVVKDAATVEITGVVDWDFAFFGPKFMALRAPTFAWMEDRLNCESNEQHANYQPEGRTNRAVRHAYCDAASHEYVTFAFAPEAILARRMFQVVTKGMLNRVRMDESASIARDWNALYPSDMIYRPFHPDEGSQQSCVDAVNCFEKVGL